MYHGNNKLGRIVITGGNGMVGNLINFGIKFSHKELDVCNIKVIRNTLDRYKPSVLLHLAALNLITCEQHPDKAYEVNVVGTLNIAKACREKGVRMVYISTCIVYEGTKKTPYDENDIPNPIHVYGHTKRIGELITLDIAPNSLIIRPGWLFGNNKVNKGFVNLCLNKLINKKDLEVLTINRLGSPTYIPDLLKETESLIKQHARGIYHVVNTGKASYFDLGKEIKKIGKFEASVKKADAKDIIPEFPKRGIMEALTSRRIKLRSWKDAMSEYLKTI